MNRLEVSRHVRGRRATWIWTLPLLLALLSLSCGGGGSGSSHSETETRPFALASTGAQLVLNDPRGYLLLTQADLGTDVDIISFHNDFYGIPWDEFENGTTLPAPWVEEMDRQAAFAVSAGKPVFLSLQLVAGSGRRYLADKAVYQSGVLSLQSQWSAECYDFAVAPDGTSKRNAYLAYVEWMVRKFDPVHVNIAIEMNLFMSCNAAWDGLVAVANAAYDRVKAVKPRAVVFPSIQIDLLYGYGGGCASPGDPACFEANYARLRNLKRDRFAISTYPHLISNFIDPTALPADWFTRAASRNNEPMVIAETGWNSTPVRALSPSGCVTVLDSSETNQLAYFDRLIQEATTNGMDLVTWWSNRDVLPVEVMTDCPCTFDPAWCGVVDLFRATGGSDPTLQYIGEVLLKAFGTMGLRDYDGNPKPGLFSRWSEVRAVPVAGSRQ